MWLYFPRIFQWPLCEYVWLLGTKNNDGVATSFRRNPRGKGSREMFLLLFSHVLFNVGSFCTLSSSCAFCNSPNVYFGIFFIGPLPFVNLCLSLFISQLLIFSSFAVSFSQCFQTVGCVRFYYMLTLLLRLALAIIGCLASSLYITYTHKHTLTYTYTQERKKRQSKKARQGERKGSGCCRRLGLVSVYCWSWLW